MSIAFAKKKLSTFFTWYTILLLYTIYEYMNKYSYIIRTGALFMFPFQLILTNGKS